MSDVSSFGVSVKLEALPKEEGGFFGGIFNKLTGKKATETAPDAEKWTKETSLYPRKSAYPAKSKTLAFNFDKDILCKLEYDDDTALPAGTNRWRCGDYST